LRVILAELDGVPNLGSDDLKDARDNAITLELTNRFAHVRGGWFTGRIQRMLIGGTDPQADEKALWVQAKRGVLAILRVQPAQDLVESLMRPVTEDDEIAWEAIIDNEMEHEQMKQHSRRLPSTTGAEAAYRLEDIRS
jgi:Ras GTPase-activating-like protein IQGAP2/3